MIWVTLDLAVSWQFPHGQPAAAPGQIPPAMQLPCPRYSHFRLLGRAPACYVPASPNPTIASRRDREQQRRTADPHAAGAAGTDSASDPLYGRRRRDLLVLQRRIEMAGCDLSGRRSAVQPRIRLAHFFLSLRLADMRAGCAAHPAADRACAAQHIAVHLADPAADRVQHDAVGERDRDQFLSATVRSARLTGVPEGADWRGTF